MLRMVLQTALAPTPWTPSPLGLLRARAYGNASSSLYPKGRHWYLHAIGVHPDAQGQGVGRALLRHMLQLAGPDAIHLQTNDPANLPIYARYGFEVTGELNPSPDGPGHWGMVRPAGAE